VSPNAIGISCCDVINRGAFYVDGKVIYNLLDGHTVAVDAATGHELWKTRSPVSRRRDHTHGPFVVKDRVMVVRPGRIRHPWMGEGLDLQTGRILWTARNLGPDADMLVKADTFKPFYDKGANLGQTSWPGLAWKIGGAPVWAGCPMTPSSTSCSTG